MGLWEWGPVKRHLVSPWSTPWDYFFSKRQGRWVIVHPKDGRRIGGAYGGKSYVSSSPAEEQIYLEEVWTLGENGEFLGPVESTAGIIIFHDQILAVEFFGENRAAEETE